MSVLAFGDKKFLVVGNDDSGNPVVLEATFVGLSILYGDAGDTKHKIKDIERDQPHILAEWLNRYAADNGVVGSISVFDQTNINDLTRSLSGFRVEIPFVMASTGMEESINADVNISEYGVTIGFENYVSPDSSSTKAHLNSILSIDYTESPNIHVYADYTKEDPTHCISLCKSHIETLSVEEQQNYIERYIKTVADNAKLTNSGNGYYFNNPENYNHDEPVNHFQFGLSTHGFDAVIAHAKYYVDPSCYCESVRQKEKIHFDSDSLVKDVTALLSVDSRNNHESAEKYLVYAINAAIAATLYAKGDLSDIHTILIGAVETLISDYGYKTCAATTPRLLNNYIEEINVKKAALSSLDSLALDEGMEADELSVMKY